MLWFSSIRDLLQRHTVAVTAVTVIVAAFCLGTLVDSPKPPMHFDAYYMDLNTGALFIAAASEGGIVPAPSGPLLDSAGAETSEPAGVRAYVFSCTDCSDRASVFVGWLEKYERSSRRRGEEAADASVGTAAPDAQPLRPSQGEDEASSFSDDPLLRNAGPGTERRSDAGDEHAVDAPVWHDDETGDADERPRRRRWSRMRWDGYGPEGMDGRGGRHRISAGPGEPWVSSYSDKAEDLRASVNGRCPEGQVAQPCRPLATDH